MNFMIIYIYFLMKWFGICYSIEKCQTDYITIYFFFNFSDTEIENI